MSRNYLANKSGKTGIASPLHPWLELESSSSLSFSNKGGLHIHCKARDCKS